MPLFLLQLIPSPNGRWSALYATESQWHCTLLGLLNHCIIQTIWQVAKFDRSSKPWRCGLQIITNQLLHTHLHFLLICISSLLSRLLFQVKKADKNFSKQMQLPGTSLNWVYSEHTTRSRYFKVFPCDLGYVAKWPATFLAAIGEVRKS